MRIQIDSRLVSDLLMGIRYSVYFDGRGRPKPTARRNADCRKIMMDIVDSMGGLSPGLGVVSLNPERRELERRREIVAAVIGAKCRSCRDWQEGDCSGVTSSEVLYLPARKAPDQPVAR